MIWFLTICNGPFKNYSNSVGTPCKIMVGLSGNGLSWTWKRPWTWPTKMFLTISIWLGGGVKGLIVTHIYYLSLGRLGRRWNYFLISTQFVLVRPCCCVLIFFLQWMFNLYPKRNVNQTIIKSTKKLCSLRKMLFYVKTYPSKQRRGIWWGGLLLGLWDPVLNGQSRF